MESPASLPKDLEYASDVDDDASLFRILVKKPPDLISYFQCACFDEEWAKRHRGFLGESIRWMTEQFFQDKLLVDLAREAAEAMREHFHILEPLIPNNLTIVYNGHEVPANSLMWGAACEHFRTLIRQECRDKGSTKMEITDISPEIFSRIQQYIETGKVSGMWRLEPHDVIDVLRKASEWGLEGLMLLCEEDLTHYVSRSNVLETLLMAHEEEWNLLKDTCIEFINGLHVGVRFDNSRPMQLAFEFLNFDVDAMEIFDRIKFHVTRLICSGNLSEQPEFSEVIQLCPKMVCLDISRSEAFSDRLQDIPSSLEQLDVSRCAWLTHKTLKKLALVCPNLTRIHLASNVQLNYSAWSNLKDFARLQELDIANCNQMTNEDFRIVLQACRSITHLSIRGCTGLSDDAFLEIGKHLTKLTDADFSRCRISDSGLVDVITRCRQLVTLDLSRCPDLTDKGITDAVRNASNLKTINISQCNISKISVKNIRTLRPFLEVIK